MKRFLFFVALLCTALTSMQAQYIKEEKFKRDMIEPWDLLGGPKVGVSASNLTSLGGSYVVGPVVGGFIETMVNKNFHISGEVFWSHQGTSDFDYIAPTTQELRSGCDISLDYINIAFLAHWYPAKNLPVNVYSGLSVSRVFNSKLKNDTGSHDLEDSIREQDFSVPVGLACEFGHWVVDARYNFGLAKLADGDATKDVLGDAHNSMVSLTVGYKFLFW